MTIFTGGPPKRPSMSMDKMSLGLLTNKFGGPQSALSGMHGSTNNTNSRKSDLDELDQHSPVDPPSSSSPEISKASKHHSVVISHNKQVRVCR
jgi:hypothetical protein